MFKPKVTFMSCEGVADGLGVGGVFWVRTEF